MVYGNFQVSMLCCTQMKQKNWSAKDILEVPAMLCCCTRWRKKKHCGHQYIKVIRKVTVYLGPNLILQSLFHPQIWVWLESEWNWVLSNEIGYQFTNICTIFHRDKTWFLKEEYRQQSNEDTVMANCLHKILCIPSNTLQKIWEDVMYWYWLLSFTKLNVAASLAKKG